MTHTNVQRVLRQARRNQTVSPLLHRRIVAAAHASRGPQRRSFMPAAAALAMVLAGVGALVWLQPTGERAAGASVPLAVARALDSSLPAVPPGVRLDSRPLELEWQALEADLVRLRPRLPWPPAPAEI